jgi:hypothetical protein
VGIMINFIVKVLTSLFMKNVIIKTVYGEDECMTFFCVTHMSLRAVWCDRQVVLNQDGTVTGINPSRNTWEVARK